MVTLLDGIICEESPKCINGPHPIFLTAPASSEFTTPSLIFLSQPVRCRFAEHIFCLFRNILLPFRAFIRLAFTAKYRTLLVKEQGHD
jgi:hypothetical protein